MALPTPSTTVPSTALASRMDGRLLTPTDSLRLAPGLMREHLGHHHRDAPEHLLDGFLRMRALQDLMLETLDADARDDLSRFLALRTDGPLTPVAFRLAQRSRADGQAVAVTVFTGTLEGYPVPSALPSSGSATAGVVDRWATWWAYGTVLQRAALLYEITGDDGVLIEALRLDRCARQRQAGIPWFELGDPGTVVIGPEAPDDQAPDENGLVGRDGPVTDEGSPSAPAVAWHAPVLQAVPDALYARWAGDPHRALGLSFAQGIEAVERGACASGTRLRSDRLGIARAKTSDRLLEALNPERPDPKAVFAMLHGAQRWTTPVGSPVAQDTFPGPHDRVQTLTDAPTAWEHEHVLGPDPDRSPLSSPVDRPVRVVTGTTTWLEHVQGLLTATVRRRDEADPDRLLAKAITLLRRYAGWQGLPDFRTVVPPASETDQALLDRLGSGQRDGYCGVMDAAMGLIHQGAQAQCVPTPVIDALVVQGDRVRQDVNHSSQVRLSGAEAVLLARRLDPTTYLSPVVLERLYSLDAVNAYRWLGPLDQQGVIDALILFHPDQGTQRSVHGLLDDLARQGRITRADCDRVEKGFRSSGCPRAPGEPAPWGDEAVLPWETNGRWSRECLSWRENLAYELREALDAWRLECEMRALADEGMALALAENPDGASLTGTTRPRL